MSAALHRANACGEPPERGPNRGAIATQSQPARRRQATVRTGDTETKV